MLDRWKKILRADTPTVTEGICSFSQSGEDLIVDFLLKMIGETEISYLDLGANDPVKFNNTYKFYLEGRRGLLVEPDPVLTNRITSLRPRDLCLEKAVGVSSDSEVQFFRMSSDTLSTTNKSTAERYQKETEHSLDVSFSVPSLGINDLLSNYFADYRFNFVSLDVEGLDSDIVSAWDFGLYRPAVMCIETLTYTQNGDAEKVEEIFNRMNEANYLMYADTYINTIFVDGNRFVPARLRK